MSRVSLIRESLGSEPQDAVQDLDLGAISSRSHATTDLDLEMLGKLCLVPVELSSNSKRIEIITMHDSGDVPTLVEEDAWICSA